MDPVVKPRGDTVDFTDPQRNDITLNNISYHD
nr:hypothetical protein [Rickettsia australis]